MAEREFPTLPPMESAEVMGEQQDAMPADAPMQLAQAGGGLPPAEMRPTPRNPVVGGIADFVRNVRSMADQYEIKDWVPLLGGMGVGELLIGKAPEEIEEWAYGNAPMRIPEMSNIPVMKTGRGEQLADTAFLGLDAAGITKGLGVIGKGAARQLAPKANELLSDYMQRSGLQSNLMAYHGTPHRIDKFDSSKIGTGQGAQSFGYGLYFAQNPKVAKEYSMLGQIAEIDGVPVSGKGSRVSNANAAKKLGINEDSLNRLALSDFDVGRTLRELDAEYAAATTTGDKAFVMQQIGDLKRLMKSEVNIKAGNLYTVDVADDAVSKMLDFDAPLGQQSPEIQALAKQYNLSMDDLGGDLLAAARGKTPAGAQALREAGVTGVRYLDQGSRGTGDGTRNLVVFPGGEDQIKIIKTEGTK
jgi:hypothetical protein